MNREQMSSLCIRVDMSQERILEEYNKRFIELREMNKKNPYGNCIADTLADELDTLWHSMNKETQHASDKWEELNWE